MLQESATSPLHSWLLLVCVFFGSPTVMNLRRKSGEGVGTVCGALMVVVVVGRVVHLDMS